MANMAETKLQKVRPRLHEIAPLTSVICRGYVGVNILLAIGLLQLEQPSTPFFIVNDIFTFEFWAFVFLALGIWILYGLITNRWQITRFALLMGLVVKAAWLLALLFRVTEGGSILIPVIWSFFAYIQAVTYIYFTPKGHHGSSTTDGIS